jgi:hypothetical protein
MLSDLVKSDIQANFKSLPEKMEKKRIKLFLKIRRRSDRKFIPKKSILKLAYPDRENDAELK